MTSALFKVVDVTQTVDEEVGIRRYLILSTGNHRDQPFNVTRLIFDTSPKTASAPYAKGPSLWVRVNVPVDRQQRPLKRFRSGGYSITVTTNKKGESMVTVKCQHQQTNARLHQVHVATS